MTSDCLQSAKKEWQAFQSGVSELDCVSCEFTKYGKALLRSRSQSWSKEMSLLLCRSSGLCCTSSWGVVWLLVSGPLKIDMGQTSVSSLSQRTSGKCLKGLFSDSLFTHPHRYLNKRPRREDVTFQCPRKKTKFIFKSGFYKLALICYLRDAMKQNAPIIIFKASAWI